MSYYKDTNNKLHLLEDDAYAYLLPAGAIQITEAEADTIRAAELTNPDWELKWKQYSRLELI